MTKQEVLKAYENGRLFFSKEEAETVLGHVPKSKEIYSIDELIHYSPSLKDELPQRKYKEEDLPDFML